MTNPNKTHISIVVDRSGSMAGVKSDAEAAINQFLTDQKAEPGECTLLLVDFDSQEPFRVVIDGKLGDALAYKLDPRGMTPLLDACGRAIIATGQKLEALAEDDRPGKVIFVIQTDGMENNSHEFTWASLAGLIKTQTEVYNWQFIFLGMGLDTFKQGEVLGVQNVVRVNDNNAVSNANTYAVASSYVSSYRSGASEDMSAMRGMTVNSVGQVFNAKGEEIDPKTGKIITPDAVS